MKLPHPNEIKDYDLEKAQQTALEFHQIILGYQELNNFLSQKISKVTDYLESEKQKAFFSQEQFENMQRRMFGKSTERRPQNPKKEKKKRETFGVKPQKALPVQDVFHELKKEGLNCKSCGKEMDKWEGQYEESQLIHVIPAQFILQNHKRQKYRCSCGGCIETAPGSIKMKEKSRYSVDFAIEVGIDKYQSHLPLDRQRRRMRTEGLDVTNNVLYGQVETVAWYLKSAIYDKLPEKIKSQSMLMMDESPWKNLGSKKPSKFYLWALRSQEAVYFQIADTRSGKVAEDLLEGYQGVLLTDGYAGYTRLGSEHIVLANDWDHFRRKFVESEKNFKAESEEMLDLIGNVYHIEKQLRSMTVRELQSARTTQVKPIVDQIFDRLKQWKGILPQSSLGKAVSYALKREKGLTVFLNHPEVCLSTADVERAIKSPVLGRKNHFGSKNLESAKTAAVWYSIIATCEIYEIEPRDYIRSALYEILTGQPPPMPWDFAEYKKLNPNPVNF